MMFWHVTSIDNATAILAGGFKGGWGDNGFGVYLFDDLATAHAYAIQGGWDESLPTGNTVILEIEDPGTDIYPVEVQPDWPNPEDYDHVLMRPMEDRDGDNEEAWRPAGVFLLSVEPQTLTL